MENCHRFNGCSVPICPLDPDMARRVYVRGEPKCRMRKSVRMRLGSGLSWKGMTAREFGQYKVTHPGMGIEYPKYRVVL